MQIIQGGWGLFLISILHQTTTVFVFSITKLQLFLISILHQTTTRHADYTGRLGVVSYFNSTSNHNCLRFFHHETAVVSYFNSTSNHNKFRYIFIFLWLFLISILHQTTTSDMRFVDCHSVMWPNERYERRMTGRGSRNDAGFVFQRYFSLKVECTSRARNRYMFAK